jgi:hypothetical protein
VLHGTTHWGDFLSVRSRELELFPRHAFGVPRNFPEELLSTETSLLFLRGGWRAWDSVTSTSDGALAWLISSLLSRGKVEEAIWKMWMSFVWWHSNESVSNRLYCFEWWDEEMVSMCLRNYPDICLEGLRNCKDVEWGGLCLFGVLWWRLPERTEKLEE